MSGIKEGTLVKAWDDDSSNFVIGKVTEQVGSGYFIAVDESDAEPYDNAIELPLELVKQLEELGG